MAFAADPPLTMPTTAPCRRTRTKLESSAAATDRRADLATGSYVPDIVVRNEDLAKFGCDPEWIVQRTGIRERRQLRPTWRTSDLAAEGGAAAMQSADVSPADIDLIVLGTFTPDMPVPSTACQVQDRLGMRCAAFDVSAACAGFMYALVTGAQFVATGCSKLALVIGADATRGSSTRTTRKPIRCSATAPARCCSTAAATTRTDRVHAGGRRLGRRTAVHEGWRLAQSGHARNRSSAAIIHADGRPAVFKWAVRLLDDRFATCCEHAKLTIDDVDLFVLHQANIRIIDAAAEELGIDREKDVREPRPLRQHVGRQRAAGARRSHAARPHPARRATSC